MMAKIQVLVKYSNLDLKFRPRFELLTKILFVTKLEFSSGLQSPNNPQYCQLVLNILECRNNQIVF